MKKFLHYFFLFVGFSVFSQSITVNDPNASESYFSAEELIGEVLVGGGSCTDVDLLETFQNPDAETDSSLKSYGYFEGTGTDFPFERGIVLSTGFANSAAGPNDATNSEDGNGWGGDADLQALLNAQYSTPDITQNATSFTFTFIPFEEEINLNFIFASEEYENLTECDETTRDGFAFLLSGPGIPDDSGTPFGGTNLAVVPETLIPVNSLSIHSASVSCSTEIEGVNFFPEMYVSNFAANNTNEIQYNGFTNPMTATANVIIGETYTIKIVIADRGSHVNDSAIFLEMGSMRMSATAYEAGNLFSCEEDLENVVFDLTQNEAAILGNQIPTDFNISYYTSLDDANAGVSGTEIADPENYGVSSWFENIFVRVEDLAGNCFDVTQFNVQAPISTLGEFDPVEVCDSEDDAPNNGFYEFDLDEISNEIENSPAAFIVSYYETETDALADINGLNSPYVNEIAYNDQIFVRFESLPSNCVEVRALDLIINDVPVVNMNPATIFTCAATFGSSLGIFDLSPAIPDILTGLTVSDYDVNIYNSLNNANNGTNPINDITEYQAPSSTVYVAVSFAGEECSVIVALPLVVDSTQSCFSIDVNNIAFPETSYSAEQLISDVLIEGGGCGEIAMTYLQQNPNGANNPNTRSWGYFEAGETDFPFERGIILASSYAVTAEGPNNSGAGASDGDYGWAGDNDLKILLDNEYGGNVSTNNATVFEFTFTPFVDEISFEFIFASEEYENQFECSNNYRDGFAFLLEGPGIPDESGAPFGGINIASVPGSDNVPVSTQSIHADYFTCGGEIENTNFFPDLYVSNQGVNNTDVIQFDGMTSVLTAFASVTPGEEYTLKLVIADRGDTSYDSAVFFNAGSLNLGIDLGEDILISAGTAPCEGEEMTLTASNSGTGIDDYTWFFQDEITGDFNIIDGATTSEVTVAQSGTYMVQLNVNEDCTPSDTIVVEFAPNPEIQNEPEDLNLCVVEAAEVTFDLTSNESIILGDQNASDFIFTYHNTLEDAVAGTADIDTPTAYGELAPGTSETIYFRIEDNAGLCSETGSFEISLFEVNVGTMQHYEICTVGADEVGEFDLTTKDAEALAGQDPDNYTVAYYISETDAETGSSTTQLPDLYTNISSPQVIWVRVTNNDNPDCYAINSFELIGYQNPVANDAEEIVLCELGAFDLTVNTALVLGEQDSAQFDVFYYNSSEDAEAGTGPGEIADPSAYVPAALPETIYVRIENIEHEVCYDITEFIIDQYAVAVGPMTPLESCSPNADGYAVFNLNDKDEEALNGQVPEDYTVAYYLSETEAHEAVVDTDISLPYVNQTPYSQVVWVRVSNNENPDCYEIAPLELVAHDTPEAITPADILQC
ncbi:MAG TPA: choice-of-anchor L domain-containing protein, partial [Salinimicrobium sp.]|nr:choice-of-anchor L domain-containing protein [Salinimicrobium sp.]